MKPKKIMNPHQNPCPVVRPGPRGRQKPRKSPPERQGASLQPAVDFHQQALGWIRAYSPQEARQMLPTMTKALADSKRLVQECRECIAVLRAKVVKAGPKVEVEVKARECAVCGGSMAGRRAQTRTCSEKCRQKWHRVFSDRNTFAPPKPTRETVTSKDPLKGKSRVCACGMPATAWKGGPVCPKCQALEQRRAREIERHERHRPRYGGESEDAQ